MNSVVRNASSKPGSGTYQLRDLRQVNNMPSAPVSLEMIIATHKD